MLDAGVTLATLSIVMILAASVQTLITNQQGGAGKRLLDSLSFLRRLAPPGPVVQVTMLCAGIAAEGWILLEVFRASDMIGPVPIACSIVALAGVVIQTYAYLRLSKHGASSFHAAVSMRVTLALLLITVYWEVTVIGLLIAQSALLASAAILELIQQARILRSSNTTSSGSIERNQSTLKTFILVFLGISLLLLFNISHFFEIMNIGFDSFDRTQLHHWSAFISPVFAKIYGINPLIDYPVQYGHGNIWLIENLGCLDDCYKAMSMFVLLNECSWFIGVFLLLCCCVQRLRLVHVVSFVVASLLSVYAYQAYMGDLVHPWTGPSLRERFAFLLLFAGLVFGLFRIRAKRLADLACIVGAVTSILWSWYFWLFAALVAAIHFFYRCEGRSILFRTGVIILALPLWLTFSILCFGWALEFWSGGNFQFGPLATLKWGELISPRYTPNITIQIAMLSLIAILVIYLHNISLTRKPAAQVLFLYAAININYFGTVPDPANFHTVLAPIILVLVAVYFSRSAIQTLPRRSILGAGVGIFVFPILAAGERTHILPLDWNGPSLAYPVQEFQEQQDELVLANHPRVRSLSLLHQMITRQVGASKYTVVAEAGDFNHPDHMFLPVSNMGTVVSLQKEQISDLLKKSHTGRGWILITNYADQEDLTYSEWYFVQNILPSLDVHSVIQNKMWIGFDASIIDHEQN